jgi:hypothetical protein
VDGKESVAMAIGIESKAKASLGSWIVLTEWDEDHIICLKSVKIDGKRMKADTWYMLKDGKFVKSE